MKAMKIMERMILMLTVVALLIPSCTSPADDGIDENDTTPPAIPSGLAVDENESVEDSIKIVWTANRDKDFDYYCVYRAELADQESNYQLIDETISNYYLDVGVGYDTTYYYRVSAIDKNDNESDKSEAVSFQPYNLYMPATPSNFKVYGYNIPEESEPRIHLYWSANTESDFSHYNIYRDVKASFPLDADHLLIKTNDLQYNDYEVTVGEKFYYRITAVDKGELTSNPTASLSDAPLPQPNLLFPDSAGTTATLTPAFEWQLIEGATKYVVILQTSFSSGEKWSAEVTQPSSGDKVSKSYDGSTLSYSTTYYWKVAVYSSDNTAANCYSKSVWRFVTRAQS
jgi:hypothetical protein